MIEITLIQVIFYLILWISSEYLASLISAVMIPIFIGILVVSILAELIEKSKVPKIYFHFLIVSVIIPLIIGLFFLYIYGGKFDWLEKI